MRCAKCSAEFTIKTDPKNSDYVCEHGVSRNFEPWREKERVVEEAKKKRQEEDEDAMKRLENRTLDSKMEMEIMDALDEIKALNSRNAKIDSVDVLKEFREKENQEKSKEENDLETETKSVVFKSSSNFVKRLLPQNDEPEEDLQREEKKSKGEDNQLTKTTSFSILTAINVLPQKKAKKEISKNKVMVKIGPTKTKSSPKEVEHKQEETESTSLSSLVDY